MKKKRILKMTGLLLATILIAGASSGCQNAAGKAVSGGVSVTVHEAAHSLFFAPLYVAIEEGYFAEEGIDLILTAGNGAAQTMDAVLSGAANIGFLSSEASLYTYIDGTEDAAVNFAQLTQRAGDFLVSRRPIAGAVSDPVKGKAADAGSSFGSFTWDMLAGRQVLGGRAGEMPQVVLEFILKKNGLDPLADLTITQDHEFGSTAAAFASGQGDFTIELEPQATLLEQQGAGYVVASLGEESGYVPYTAFCARNSYITMHPDIIQGFTTAVQRGLDYVHAHSPEEIAETVGSQFPELEQETLTLIISRYYEQGTWKEDLIFSQASFTLLQNLLEEAGTLPQRVPYEELVTTEFAEAATAGPLA